jgi:hypothetical protein
MQLLLELFRPKLRLLRFLPLTVGKRRPRTD